MLQLFLTLFLVFSVSSVSCFTHAAASCPRTGGRAFSGKARMSVPAHLVEPPQRDSRYGEPLNVAQYLVDLHDAKATFDFCGGMMFQLVLSEKLRDHLVEVAKDDKGAKQPLIADASKMRMFNLEGYSQSAGADNVRLFHGREIRKVPNAAGGMGFVLQLSMAGEGDPEGWTPQEVKGYDGWGHDVGRTWRKGDRLEKEGFSDFREKFGPESFALHHRFYLHFDGSNRMWLSAEDGCEGTPGEASFNPFASFLGLGR